MFLVASNRNEERLALEEKAFIGNNVLAQESRESLRTRMGDGDWTQGGAAVMGMAKFAPANSPDRPRPVALLDLPGGATGALTPAAQLGVVPVMMFSTITHL